MRSRKFLVVVVVLLLLALPLTILALQNHSGVTIQKPTQTGQNTKGSPIQRYLYVLPEGGTMFVYDIDHNHALVKTITLPPEVRFIRGVGADPASHSLYIAYGSVSSEGQLMKMDLLTNQVIYNKQMPVGIDSFDITPDGKKIYMPDGDGQSDGIWRVVDAATGDVTASIDTGGHNPHNTFVSINGTHVYMGPRLSNYLVMADTATNQIIRQIGPMQSGVRPFTINSKETLAFIETSDFLGFDVADIATGKIIYTVPIPGKSTAGGFAPAHGISLSPDERELYVSDWPNSKVHVFDITGLPGSAPKLITDIPVHHMVGSDTPCVASNCMKEGWLLHSLDGRFVYVGDAGDVIDTRTRQSVAFLQPLANTRKFIEIDWQNGVPIATSSRYGKGYAGIGNHVVDPTTNQVIKQIGPFKNGGIRPFIVNGSETLVFVTDNDFIGFEVGDITTGKVLYTVPATGFTCKCASYDSPSHGISLSPDEKEVYIPDRFNQYAHVFNVSHLPAQPPTRIADIPLTHPISGDVPPPCSLDCMREGWVLHSRDGKFVYVGNSGDVIDTSLRKVVAYVPGLNNSRIYCEIDWRNGTPVLTTNRYGVGYIGT